MSNGTTNVGNLTANVDPVAGKETGRESSLSSWAGPMVTDMFARAQALSKEAYMPYSGPLTAGPSDLQTQAFQGLSNLVIPTNTSYTPGSFTATSAEQYMNPFLMAALDPQLEEARRQAGISRLGTAGRLSKAGAYGGSRQAIMESELDRNLLMNLGKITGEGYKTAYDKAMDQFNIEQKREMDAARQAQTYGLEALAAQQKGGETQRGIEQAGISADLAEFEKQREYPYKQISWLQGLLQGMPLAAQSYNYAEPSGISNLFGVGGGLLTLLEMMGVMGKKPAGSSGTTGGSSGTTTP